MYELVDYLAMVEDPVRTTAYLAAMRKTIREGDHVLELGTGFGFFAVAACRFGAAHVDAVEPNDAIALGPALAEANGCAGKITFHQMSSQQLALPRRADVLIEDLRGVSPLHLDRLGTLRDAHARLLTPDAHSIPRIDRLWCAASEWPDGGRPYQPTASAEVQGIDLGSVRRVAGDVMQRTHQGADALLTEGAEWSAVDLRDPSTAGTSGEVSLRVRRAGRCAAIVTWFSTELVEGIGYDTAPQSADTVYGRGLLPLSRPLALERDDVLQVRLRAVFDGTDHVWSWEVTAVSAGGAARDTVHGSTLASQIISAGRRARRAASYRPSPSPTLAQMRTLIDLVDGATALGGIAPRLRAAHPAAFVDDAAALRWAAERLAADVERPSA